VTDHPRGPFLVHLYDRLDRAAHPGTPHADLPAPAPGDSASVHWELTDNAGAGHRCRRAASLTDRE